MFQIATISIHLDIPAIGRLERRGVTCTWAAIRRDGNWRYHAGCTGDECRKVRDQMLAAGDIVQASNDGKEIYLPQHHNHGGNAGGTGSSGTVTN